MARALGLGQFSVSGANTLGELSLGTARVVSTEEDLHKGLVGMGVPDKVDHMLSLIFAVILGMTAFYSESIGVEAWREGVVCRVTFMDLEVMKSCHDFNSTMSLESLATIWKRYTILNEYVLHVPGPGTVYCLFRSLVEHSCINPKSIAFGYLNKKPIDTGLMKFFGLCPSTLSWYLEFASAFFTSSAPFTTNALSPWEQRIEGQRPRNFSNEVLPLRTMVLSSPWPYYPLPYICIPSFAIGRSTSMALWCSSESTSFLTITLLLGS
ncbi:hypothetical protein B296_00049564 [Ensete ventricosum]|uniref:Uncharacterized protein n=1 Tax=Ensete ventricosum TaxID=4639 RepID=A0A426X0T7_ENSVE|nr:hypothetical protein B296_00049564 [Ensete ventricosum]